MSDTFLPEIKQETAIVAKNTGRATPQFLRFFNVDFRGAIKRLLDGQSAQITALEEIVNGLQSANQIAQGAQAAANDAQTTADDALGGGSVSGSATNPSVDLTVNGAWVAGPVVSLTGVVAGNLTFSGSGPIQDDNVNLLGSNFAAGEYRLVEVIGGVDDVLLTESFSLFSGGSVPAIVSNTGAPTIAAYVSARASTGAVDYRIDARKVSGAFIQSLSLYIFARRAA